jgi:transposase-like protein
MGRKSKYTIKQKIKACEDYLNGYKSAHMIGNEIGANVRLINHWAKIYQSLGADAFLPTQTNNHYSKEFKLDIVKEYLGNYLSVEDTAIQLNINRSVVRSCIRKYNKGDELKDYDHRSEVYHMKSRKTTINERLEIVKYCLDHDQQYKLAADKYNIPYANVFHWTKKYLEEGESALKYKQIGRPSKKSKANKKLTELDKMTIKYETEKARADSIRKS